MPGRAKRLLGFLALGVPALLAAPWIWLKSVESRRWSRMEQRVAELRRDADRRCGPRPVLRGEPLPGDAWDDYRKAIAKAGGMGPPDRSRMKALLDQYGEAVDLMQSGTRRGAARRARLHETEPDEGMQSGSPLGRASAVAVLAAGRARLLLEQGRPREAADLLLDVCRFAADVARDGSAPAEAFGQRIAFHGLDEIQNRLLVNGWPPEELSRMARELGDIEAAWPPTEFTLLGELEAFGDRILNHRLSKLPPEAGPGWRQGWSLRLLKASAFDEVEVHFARLRDVDAGTYAEEKRRRQESAHEILNSANPFVPQVEAAYPTGKRREQLAHLRLLRAALHHAATGELLPLEDPFGDRIRHEETADGHRFWSAGATRKIVVRSPRRP